MVQETEAAKLSKKGVANIIEEHESSFEWMFRHTKYCYSTPILVVWLLPLIFRSQLGSIYCYTVSTSSKII